MDNEQLNKLISKYLDGRATQSERYVVETLLDALEGNEEEPFQTDTGKKYDTLADTIVAKAIKRPSKNAPSFWSYLVGAAALFLLIFAGFFYFKAATNNNGKHTLLAFDRYETGIKELKRLQLPDGTIIFLNANSSIEVPRSFMSQNERTVKLTGEAFFEVKRDVNKPFKVYADHLNVKVLGTSFNVKAYQQLNEIKVAVATGKVLVSKQISSLAYLTPGQELIYNRSDKTFHAMHSEQGTGQWRDGVTVLDKASFEELKNAFYNCYGIRLSSQNKQVLSERYNFTIRSSRTQAQALGQFCEIINKNYRKEGDLIIIY